MKNLKRRTVIFLTLCLMASLSGCGKWMGDAGAFSGERDISAEKSAEDSSAGSSFFENSEDGLLQSLEAAVQILADDFQGSGIIYAHWEDSAVVVTAAHVIPPQCREIKIIFGDGQEAICVDYLSMEDVDCAFLILGEDSLPEGWQEKYGVVKKDRERFDAMLGGEGVFLADSQADNDLGCRFATIIDNWIYVEDFATHMMLLSGEARGGMSGCGVFEENGCFLGILCGGNEKGELAVLPYSLIETNFAKAYPKEN